MVHTSATTQSHEKPHGESEQEAQPMTYPIAMTKITKDQMFDDDLPVGAFFIQDCEEAGTKYRALWVRLPSNHDEIGWHSLPLKPEAPTQRASWEFDGNEDAPTLHPSIKSYWYPRNPDGTKTQTEDWHGFIRAGQIVLS